MTNQDNVAAEACPRHCVDEDAKENDGDVNVSLDATMTLYSKLSTLSV